MKRLTLQKTRQSINEAFETIFDKRLYGFGFAWQALFFLCFILVIPAYVFQLFSWPLVVIYVAGFSVYFSLSGLLTKNFHRKESRSVPSLIRFLFVLTSGLSFAFFFIAGLENLINGLWQNLLLFIIPMLSLFISVIEVTMPGQRFSLRRNIGLTDGFIDKQKEVWKKELANFPNSEKIINELDAGRHVARLFDEGSFSLAVLWACNVMEKIINAYTDGIIQTDPSKKDIFRNTNSGQPQSPPRQLNNLNYIHCLKPCRKDEKLSPEELWNEKRNRIAHHNYKTSFAETYGALIIFVSFVENFPKTILAWNKANLSSND